MSNSTIVATASLFAAIMLPGACAIATVDLAPKLVEFDAPGATTMNSPKCAPTCDTIAYANNAAGTIVGSYTDKFVVSHGFVRTATGGFTSFDAPGAGLGHGLNQGTVAYGINDSGQVSGVFTDAESVFHGFIRNPNGSFVTIDVPGAGTARNRGTISWSINNEGATAGYYMDARGSHGFVRSPAGKVATFDAASSGATLVCQTHCLNEQGAVTGYYFDTNYYVYRGFLREPDGQITVINNLDAGQEPGEGTFCRSIDRDGVVACDYDRRGIKGRGFLRYPDNTIDDFNKSGFRNVLPESINSSGAVTGIAIDKMRADHGFARSANGVTVVFNAPDAMEGRYKGGTFPTTINVRGIVAGHYSDARGLNHAFEWTP